MNRQRCGKCRAELVSPRQGEWTVKAKILVLAPGGSVVAKCYRCGSETALLSMSWADNSGGEAAGEPRQRRAGVRRRVDTGSET